MIYIKTIFILSFFSNNIFILTLVKRFIKQNQKLLKTFLVQGPGYAKRPLDHQVAYPI